MNSEKLPGAGCTDLSTGSMFLECKAATANPCAWVKFTESNLICHQSERERYIYICVCELNLYHPSSSIINYSMCLMIDIFFHPLILPSLSFGASSRWGRDLPKCCRLLRWHVAIVQLVLCCCGRCGRCGPGRCQCGWRSTYYHLGWKTLHPLAAGKLLDVGLLRFLGCKDEIQPRVAARCPKPSIETRREVGQTCSLISLISLFVEQFMFWVMLSCSILSILPQGLTNQDPRSRLVSEVMTRRSLRPLGGTRGIKGVGPPVVRVS